MIQFWINLGSLLIEDVCSLLFLLLTSLLCLKHILRYIGSSVYS
jgi:hypothetical protein